MESLLLSYARDLDDAYQGYEFSIWSKEQLLSYFNEALCLIAAQRPELFTEVKVVKIDPCNSYLDLCDCVKVVDVLGQSDKHGNHIRPLPKRSAKTTTWTGKRNKKILTSEISEFEIIDTSGIVRVYPDNLDPNKELYVAVRCVVEPKHYEMGDEPPSERCAFMAIARHWVLYNAKMVDGEFSQALFQSAREHREMFLGLIGLTKKADDDFEKSVKSSKNPRTA